MKREFWHGDSLELMRDIPDGSVDMILCDLPYGTTQNKWDTIIPLDRLWAEYWRICKGSVVLTAAQPFTSRLVASQFSTFRYQWVWQKEPTGNLNAKRMPMPEHEDVLVFGTGHYNPQGLKPTLRKRSASNNSRTTNYGAQKREPYTQTVTGYPTSILPFAKDRGGLHPTQKPVALFEYLIKTYTNPGETVLDNCAGSGTTAIAAMNTGRGYICIERDDEYFRRATERVASHMI